MSYSLYIHTTSTEKIHGIEWCDNGDYRSEYITYTSGYAFEYSPQANEDGRYGMDLLQEWKTFLNGLLFSINNFTFAEYGKFFNGMGNDPDELKRRVLESLFYLEIGITKFAHCERLGLNVWICES